MDSQLMITKTKNNLYHTMSIRGALCKNVIFMSLERESTDSYALDSSYFFS